MSLMALPIAVDLGERPVACWRWYVDGPVQRRQNMTRKSGRISLRPVSISRSTCRTAPCRARPEFKLKMARAMFGKGLPDAAVVYVWDNNHPVGTARRKRQL